MQTYPYYIANRPAFADATLAVSDKYHGFEFAAVSLANQDAFERAISAAVNAQSAMRQLPSYARRAVLEHCVTRFQQQSDELAQLLCIEAGKPVRDAKAEVTRMIDTFQMAADESVRRGGEYWVLDGVPRTRGYRGTTQRVPIGPCGLISPFNFPLNLAAHKIAPAIAAGCPFVLKPASFTPISALRIAAILAETDLPMGAFSVLPALRDCADILVRDPRIKLLSFTGSPDVGWAMKAKCGKKKVVLELGGNAACIVDADQANDLDDVLERLMFGSFYQSGQSCVHVQRILVHRSLFERIVQGMLTRTALLKMGDPADPQVSIGPMIHERETERLAHWLDCAQQAGATVLCGGTRLGRMFAPTIVVNCPSDQALYAEEAFGPVVLISSFDDFPDALNEVNASRFGLQAGLFTHDIRHVQLAWDTLEVGAVIINDVPSWRADSMPYGGVKDSGLGREGVRFAIEDMTETRLLVTRTR